MTAQVKHSIIRLVTWAHNIWPTGLWGIHSTFWSPPSQAFTSFYYYDRHSVWPDFPGNAHDTVDETSPTSRTTESSVITRCDHSTPPAWHPQGWHTRRRQALSYGGETLRGEIPLRENPSWWLLFVGIKLRLTSWRSIAPISVFSVLNSADLRVMKTRGEQ